MCLSEEERKLLSVAWVAAGAKYGVRIFNHIGSSSLTEAKNLAAHAQETGCVAICAMAPMFFKPGNARALALFLKEVGAAAPKLPLYYYNFPAITGVGACRCEEGECNGCC
jgi:N-acetylneuraminate lyase